MKAFLVQILLSTQVVGGAGQFILKSAGGGQIQLQAYPGVQGHQQLQTIQAVQHVHQTSPLVSQAHTSSPTPSVSPLVSQPHSSTGLTNVTMTTASATPTHMNRMSPAPNVNLVHFPNTLQPQSQVQIAGTTIPIQSLLQMQGSNLGNAGAGGLFPGQLIQGANNTSAGGYVQGQLVQGQGLGQAILQGQGSVLQTHGGTLLQNQTRGPAMIQGQVSGGNIMQGQGQGQSTLVNTQNTVIQNPNVVNVNVAHVIHSSQPGSGQQGGAVSGLQTVQGSSIPGTIIQTPEGKNILIPNQPWTSGQHLSLQNLQGLNLNVGQPTSTGSTVIQGSSGNMVQGNVIRLATQPGSQDKGVAQTVPQYINFAQQGSQIFIQRAATSGQPHNIILRTLAPPNMIQIQQPTSSEQSTQIQSVPQTSHPSFVTSHQPLGTFVSPAQQQGVQLQQVTSHGQQVKLVNQAGLPVGSQTANLPVTVNLSGQNLNLQQLQLNQLQGGIQFIQQPQQAQQQTIHKLSVPSSATVTCVNQSNSIMSQPGPIIYTQSFNQNSGPGKLVSSVSSHTQPQSGQSVNQPVPSFPQSRLTGQQTEQLQVQGTQHPLAQTLQNIHIPLSQFSGTASPTTSLTTSHYVPVTTTVTPSNGQLASVVYSMAGSAQVVPSSQVTTTATQARTVKASTAQHVIEARTNAPRLQAIQLTLEAQKQLQQIQLELKQLSAQKSLNATQTTRLQQLSVLQKKMIAQGQRQFVQTQLQGQQLQLPVVSQQSVGQPALGQPPGTSQVLDQHMFGQPALAQPHVSRESVVSTQGSIQTVTQPALTISGNPTNSQPFVTVVSSQLPSTVVSPSLPNLLKSTGKPQSKGDKSTAGQPIPSAVPQVQLTAQNSTVQSPMSGAKLPLPSTAVLHRAPPGKLPIPASSQVAVPTQIKIGNQLWTLNLTVAQKERVLAHLAKMSPEEQQLYLRQQQPVLIKAQKQQELHAQIQAQMHNQVKQQQASQTMVMVATPTKIPLTVQQLDNTAVAQAVDNQSALSPSKGIKRPAPVPDIPKGTLIHQQLSKDQMHALKPDIKTSFKSMREACRRLLRFHTFQYTGPTKKNLEKADNLFENISKELLRKKELMFDKYQVLLLEESMRESPSAEIVMIEKMVNQDLSTVVEEEKKLIKSDPDAFEPMPLKYLKKEEVLKDCKQSPVSSLDSVHVKTEQVKQEACVKGEETGELTNALELIPKVKSEPIEPCDSPCSSSGKMKLVIRNDGLNFTSSLAVDKSSSGEECDDIEPSEVSTPNTTAEEGVLGSDLSGHDSHLVQEYSMTSVKEEPPEMDEDYGGMGGELKPFQSYVVQDDFVQSDMNVEVECPDGAFVKTDSRGLDTANYSDISDVSVDETVNSSVGNTGYNPIQTSQSVDDPFCESQEAVKSLETRTHTTSHSFDFNFSQEQNHNTNTDDFSRMSSATVGFPHYPSDSANHYVNAQSDGAGIRSGHYFDGESMSASHYYQNGAAPLIHDSNFVSTDSKEEDSDSSHCSPTKEVESAISSIVGMPGNQFDASYMGTTDHRSSLDYISHSSDPTPEADGEKVYFSQSSGMVQNTKQFVKEQDNLNTVMEWDDTSSEPETENDPVLKAQMESAINSILGLSQESSSPMQNYDLDQSEAFEEHNTSYGVSQSESSCDGMGETSDGIEQEPAVEAEPASPSSAVIDDLDAAVNSILF